MLLLFLREGFNDQENMEQFYLILVVVLFALAISDLVVGVSNDAVNFLNSAIGSKAAPKWLIFLIASLGVLIGATFSSGMMEVARRGIFHPDMFFFSEIMIIFIAVMITDIILLDLFNTFGLPTSTTVSIVFELLGSAVAVSLIKITESGSSLVALKDYINSDKALMIIVGIVLSVFTAFFIGAIVQYIARLIFTFKEQKRTLKYFGALFGGMAITAMTYFMVIKGAKGASFMSPGMVDFLMNNFFVILLTSFIGWTVILQLLYILFKIDVPKVIVLIGTFGLAMAFAGNDLVNFIGVPLAGFSSFKAWTASGSVSPDSFGMGMLAEKVSTPTYMLMIAGLIMIITLISSRKARSVVATTVDLSRQSEGDERFGSSLFSRKLVRTTIGFNGWVRKFIPGSMITTLDERFLLFNDDEIKKEDMPAFDKIRASVNLVVASILISIGTSLKLPLSTTYVTFMVAMGTSLADRAWDRESAVYRINGVFTVIGGWFLTALIAFTVAGFIAAMISLLGNMMVFVFVVIAIIMIIRTYIHFNKKKGDKDDDILEPVDAFEKLVDQTKNQVVNSLINANQVYTVAATNFAKENRLQLKKALDLNKKFQKKIKKSRQNVFKTIQKLHLETLEGGHYVVRIVDYQRDILNSLQAIIEPMYQHLDNNHKPFTKPQIMEIEELVNMTDDLFNLMLHLVKEKQYEKYDQISENIDKLVNRYIQLEKIQIKRIKAKEVNSKNAVLYFNLINRSKNILSYSNGLIDAQRNLDLLTRS